MIERWIILAGEEGGPSSNKLGGIWNVIDAESETLAKLASDGTIDKDLKILVTGPYYPTPGSDWNGGKNRITDLSGYEQLDMGSDLNSVISNLKSEGIEVVTGQRRVADTTIGYMLFNTTYYQSHVIRW